MKKLTAVFLSDLYHCSLVAAMDENVTSHPHTWHGIVFNSNHSNKCSVILFIYISLMINDAKHLFMCLSFCMSYLVKQLFKSSFHFLIFFFLLSLENSLHILDRHFFNQTFFFIPPDVFFQSMAFYFLNFQRT